MLILRLKVDESIILYTSDGEVIVRINEILRNKVALGIIASESVKILRDKLVPDSERRSTMGSPASTRRQAGHVIASARPRPHSGGRD